MTAQITPRQRQVITRPTRAKTTVQYLDAQQSISEIGEALVAMADAALVCNDKFRRIRGWER